VPCRVCIAYRGVGADGSGSLLNFTRRSPHAELRHDLPQRAADPCFQKPTPLKALAVGGHLHSVQ
jgi:hypothetical protein